MSDRVNPQIWDNMNLYRSAIDAIELGVEDAQMPAARRLSSAVRNISAGLLLLLKTRLARCGASPADARLLLTADEGDVVWRRQPDGSVRPVPKSDFDDIKKTVDQGLLVKRLKDLGVSVDDTSLKAITKVRNDVEHYYLRGDGVARMKEVIGLATVFVEKFFREEMGATAAESFDEGIWKLMLQNKALLEKLEAQCEQSLKDVIVKSPYATQFLSHATCECGSQLIEFGKGRVNFVLGTCLGCGLQQEATTILETMLRVHAALGGGDDQDIAPVSSCDSCHEWSYVRAAGHCVLCGP